MLLFSSSIRLSSKNVMKTLKYRDATDMYVYKMTKSKSFEMLKTKETKK